MGSNKSASLGRQGEVFSSAGSGITYTGGFLTAAAAAPIILGPDDYVIIFSTTTEQFGTCARATSLAIPLVDSCSDGVTNPNNTFTGSYLLRFLKW